MVALMSSTVHRINAKPREVPVCPCFKAPNAEFAWAVEIGTLLKFDNAPPV